MPRGMSIERRTISALKWTAGTRLLGQSATWVVTLMLFRILSPADYGLMALVSVVVSIVSSVAEFGIGASLVQARQLEAATLKSVTGFVWLLHLALGVLLAGLAPLAAWGFAEPRLRPLLQVAALQFIFIALGAVPQALALRALNLKWLSRVELTTSIATSLATLALALYGLGVWALVLGSLFGTALRAVVLVTRGESVWPDFRVRGIGSHLDYGAKYSGGHLIWLVINQSDVLLGSRLMPRDALGVYSVSLHLATLPMSKMMGVINQVAFPAVARLQDDPERLKRRLLQACGLLTVVTVPVLWGLAAVASELVALVLGPKWASAARPLQLVALVVPLRVLGGIFNTAVTGVGRVGAALSNTIATAIVWPTCFLVGAFWGADGLAASWLVAIPTTFLLNFPRTSASVGVAFGDVLRTLVCPAVAGLAMVGSIAGTRLLIADWALMLRSGVLIAIGAAVYLVTITLLDRSVWSQLRQVMSSRSGDT
jgi:O-antigen/teichoic acid export membrane protein